MNGPNANNIFKFLRYNSKLYIPELGVCGHIKRNFEMFMIDKSGTIVEHESESTFKYLGSLRNELYMRLKC